MHRRTALQLLLGAASGAALPSRATAPPARRVPLQQSPIAGFQYHDGETLWPQLTIGAPLHLTREADNPHDPHAVALHFAGRRIGYLPRMENTAVSQLLDRGESMRACVATLARDRNPWKRVGVVVELGG